MDIQQNELPFPVSSIEFEKVYMVMDKRRSIGYSHQELSFLLGYRSLYVRDIENPLHTLRYTPKDTNYLLQIFACKLPEIMPAKIQDLFYQIKVTTTTLPDGSKTYEVLKETKSKLFVPYRMINNAEVLNTTTEGITHPDQVMQYVRHLFDSGYFDESKTALEVFEKCIKKFRLPVQPVLVAKSIAYYTAKRKGVKLVQKKNESSRTTYKREAKNK